LLLTRVKPVAISEDHVSASAIILAGGQSRRMGRPKAALRFGDSTILERIIAEVSAGFDDILIVVAPSQSESFPIEDMVSATGRAMRVLRDPVAYEGAALALVGGLAAARYEIAFVCSCDLPLLRVGVARALCEMIDGYDAVVPEIGGEPQPLCAAYSRSVRGLIAAELAAGERRLTRIIAGLNAYRPGEAEMRRVDPELRSFMNVNSPEDYAQALAVHRSLEKKN
jgi:molybdopterin-guanine dinucleotide biosynthesis protein A